MFINIINLKYTTDVSTNFTKERLQMIKKHENLLISPVITEIKINAAVGYNFYLPRRVFI